MLTGSSPTDTAQLAAAVVSVVHGGVPSSRTAASPAAAQPPSASLQPAKTLPAATALGATGSRSVGDDDDEPDVAEAEAVHLAGLGPEGQGPGSGSGPGPGLGQASQRGVWLSKRGEGLGALTAEKRRYFVLLFGADTKMLKFTYFADVVQGVPTGRKGFVPLDRASQISANGNHIIIVCQVWAGWERVV